MDNNKDITDISDNQKLTPQELAAKLDAELDEFINGLEKKAYTEGWPEDRWEEVNSMNFVKMKHAPNEFLGKLAPLYLSVGNGETSVLHDQGSRTRRGAFSFNGRNPTIEI